MRSPCCCWAQGGPTAHAAALCSKPAWYRVRGRGQGTDRGCGDTPAPSTVTPTVELLPGGVLLWRATQRILVLHAAYPVRGGRYLYLCWGCDMVTTTFMAATTGVLSVQGRAAGTHCFCLGPGSAEVLNRRLSANSVRALVQG